MTLPRIEARKKNSYSGVKTAKSTAESELWLRAHSVLIAFVLLGCPPYAATFGADIPWIAGDGSWHHGPNWQTVIEPGGFYSGLPRANDQVRIDNGGNNTVTLHGDTAVIASVRVDNGSRLVTNGHTLQAHHPIGATAVSVSDATLDVNPRADKGPAVDTNRLSIVDNGLVVLRDGAMVQVEDLVWQQGTLAGNGTLRIGSEATMANLHNRGTIRVAPLSAGEHTLRLEALGFSTLDLSAGFETVPVIDVDGVFPGTANQQTLVVDGPLIDDFSGNLKIGADDTARFNHAWLATGATIDFNGSGAPATLTGESVHLVESIINTTAQSTNVIESNVLWTTGQLNFQADSSIEFAGSTSITTNPVFLTPGAGQQLIFSGNATLNRNSFDWDSLHTIVRGGSLRLKADEIDLGDNYFDGQLDIVDGLADVEVSLHGQEWKLRGEIGLENGTLSGSKLENISRIQGNGLINTDGLNNIGRLVSVGGTLQISKPDVSTALISLDGYDSGFIFGGKGTLDALEGDILVTSPFDPMFSGTMRVGNGHAFTTDQPSLSIAEAAGETTAGELLLNGGTVSVAGSLFQAGILSVEGANATVQADLISFEATSQNDIKADLVLQANSRIGFGSTFTGNGRIVNTEGSTMYVPEGATVPLVLRNEGEVILGDEFSTSRFEVGDFDQSSTGLLRLRFNGNEIGQFDRLVGDGMARLAGELVLVLDDGYAPSLYEPTTVLHAAAGIDQIFDTIRGVQYSEGLGLAITYSEQDVNVTAALIGDADLDGTVAFADFLKLAASFGQSGTWNSGDFDGDGSVEFSDFLSLAVNFGTTTEAFPQSVPEPSGILLALCLFIPLHCKRRRLTKNAV